MAQYRSICIWKMFLSFFLGTVSQPEYVLRLKACCFFKKLAVYNFVFTAFCSVDKFSSKQRILGLGIEMIFAGKCISLNCSIFGITDEDEFEA